MRCVPQSARLVRLYRKILDESVLILYYTTSVVVDKLANLDPYRQMEVESYKWITRRQGDGRMEYGPDS